MYDNNYYSASSDINVLSICIFICKWEYNRFKLWID